MKLPGYVPHTRHEQYLVALPPALLTGAEHVTARLVLQRWRNLVSLMVRPWAEALMARGFTVEDIVASMEGPLPPVFRREPPAHRPER